MKITYICAEFGVTFDTFSQFFVLNNANNIPAENEKNISMTGKATAASRKCFADKTGYLMTEKAKKKH